MSIYQTAVKRPITTILIFLGIAIFGLFSLTRLSIDLYPDIETNSIMVMTTYSGASAEDIETNVTRPLENMLNGVSDLKHITSQSKENISIICFLNKALVIAVLRVVNKLKEYIFKRGISLYFVHCAGFNQLAALNDCDFVAELFCNLKHMG